METDTETLITIILYHQNEVQDTMNEKSNYSNLSQYNVYKPFKEKKRRKIQQ